MLLCIAGCLLLLVAGGCFLLLRNVPREIDPSSWTHSVPLHLLRSLLWGCVKTQGVLTSEWKVGGSTGGTVEFPSQKIRRALITTEKGVRFNSIHYTKYCGVCGYSTKAVRDDPTSLGAMCFPHSRLLRHAFAIANSPEFPVSPLGLIHVHGSISVYSTMSAILSQTCDIQYSMTGVRMTGKGVEMTSTNDVYIEGRLVWKAVHTFLSRNPKVTSKLKRKKIQENQPLECLTVDKKVLVAADTGIRYASIAIDYFPQHLYPWSARPLGYKLPIAQGMWTIERVVAAIQDENSRPLSLPINISFSFKRPVYMPSEIRILCSRSCSDQGESQKEIQFEVRDETLQVLHVTGKMVQLASVKDSNCM